MEYSDTSFSFSVNDLISFRANTNQKNEDGETPLHFAIRKKNIIFK
jgi:ankyrin repeat protein